MRNKKNNNMATILTSYIVVNYQATAVNTWVMPSSWHNLELIGHRRFPQNEEFANKFSETNFRVFTNGVYRRSANGNSDFPYSKPRVVHFGGCSRKVNCQTR